MAMGMECIMPTNHVLPSCFQLEIALVIGKHQNHSFKTQLDTMLDARTNHEQLQKTVVWRRAWSEWFGSQVCIIMSNAMLLRLTFCNLLIITRVPSDPNTNKWPGIANGTVLTIEHYTHRNQKLFSALCTNLFRKDISPLFCIICTILALILHLHRKVGKCSSCSAMVVAMR